MLTVLTPLVRYLGRRLRERGAISVERFKALHVLQARPLRSSDLAGQIVLSPAALTRLADGLVADHLAMRIANSADRRSVMLALTDSGRAELARGEQVVAEALDEVLERLTPAERRRLEAAFGDLRRVFDPASPAHREHSGL